MESHGGLIAAVQLSDHGEVDQPDPLYISKDDLNGMTWRHFSILLKSLFAAPPDAVRVKYMDGDGDWIELGSDAELEEAFRCSEGSGEILQLKVRRVDNPVEPLVEHAIIDELQSEATPNAPCADEADVIEYSQSDPNREGLPCHFTELGVDGQHADNTYTMYIPTTETTDHSTGQLMYPHPNEAQQQAPGQLKYPHPNQAQQKAQPNEYQLCNGVISTSNEDPPLMDSSNGASTSSSRATDFWWPLGGNCSQLDTKGLWDEAARLGMQDKILFLKQLAEKEAGKRMHSNQQDPFETTEDSASRGSQPQHSEMLIPTQVPTSSTRQSCEQSSIDVTTQHKESAAPAYPSPRRSLSTEKYVSLSQVATTAVGSLKSKLSRNEDNNNETPVPMPRNLLMMEGAQSGANAVAIEMPETDSYPGIAFNKEEEIAASGGASSTSASEETGEILSPGGGSVAAGIAAEVKVASVQADCGVAVGSMIGTGKNGHNIQLNKPQQKQMAKKEVVQKRQTDTETCGVGARPKVVEKKVKKKSDSGATKVKKVEKQEKKKDGQKDRLKDEESGETAVAEGQAKIEKSALHLEDFVKHMKKVKKDLRENIVNDVTKSTAKLLKKNIARSVSLQERSRNEGTVHTGITCDCCDQMIIGVRYKCGNCCDFDLCSKCESSEHGHDATHVFLKMLMPARKAGCVGNSRFPLLKENIYLAEKTRHEQREKKIKMQRDADIDRWLQAESRKKLIEEVSEVLESPVAAEQDMMVVEVKAAAQEIKDPSPNHLKVKAVHVNELDLTKAAFEDLARAKAAEQVSKIILQGTHITDQMAQDPLHERHDDSGKSDSTTLHVSPPQSVEPTTTAQPLADDAAAEQMLSMADKTVELGSNDEVVNEPCDALDDAMSLASGSSYEYFHSDDSEEFCILTPPAWEEENIRVRLHHTSSCEPPSYEEIQQQLVVNKDQNLSIEPPINITPENKVQMEHVRRELAGLANRGDQEVEQVQSRAGAALRALINIKKQEVQQVQPRGGRGAALLQALALRADIKKQSEAAQCHQDDHQHDDGLQVDPTYDHLDDLNDPQDALNDDTQDDLNADPQDDLHADPQDDLNDDPMTSDMPEASADSRGLGELVHTLSDQERAIYEVMLNTELKKAMQEDINRRVKEAKKDSEKDGMVNPFRRYSAKESTPPRPTPQEEEYAEILSIKAMQASLVNRSLEGRGVATTTAPVPAAPTSATSTSAATPTPATPTPVTPTLATAPPVMSTPATLTSTPTSAVPTQGEVQVIKRQESTSSSSGPPDQQPQDPQVRDNTLLYKCLRDQHMVEILDLEAQKFTALDVGDLDAVRSINDRLRLLDRSGPTLKDSCNNYIGTEPLTQQQHSEPDSSQLADCATLTEGCQGTVTPGVKDADCQTTPEETVAQASHLIHNVAQGVHKAASSAYMTAKDVFFSLQAKQTEKKQTAEMNAAGQVLWTPPAATWTPKESSWTPPKDDYVPPNSTWTPAPSDYKPPTNNYKPPQSRWTPPQDVWLPPPDMFMETAVQAEGKTEAAKEQSTKSDVVVAEKSTSASKETVAKRLSMSSMSSVSTTSSQGPTSIASLNITDSALRKEIQGMQHLIEMGFANREKNRALLSKHDGDLEKVVGSLLQEEGEGHWALDRH